MYLNIQKSIWNFKKDIYNRTPEHILNIISLEFYLKMYGIWEKSWKTNLLSDQNKGGFLNKKLKSFVDLKSEMRIKSALEKVQAEWTVKKCNQLCWRPLKYIPPEHKSKNGD